VHAITDSEYGAPPTLTDLPDPKAGPGEILVKIRAAGVNPMDRSIAEGRMQAMMPATFPLILGADLAGVVQAVGEGTSRYSSGDEVFGQLLISPLGSAGTYAEYVAVPQDAPLARVPSNLDATIAASLPTPGGAALNLVDALGPLADKTEWSSSAPPAPLGALPLSSPPRRVPTSSAPPGRAKLRVCGATERSNRSTTR